MTDSFARFRCWTPARVQDSIFGDIAALRLDADPVFLAAHTSLDVRHSKGAQLDQPTPELSALHALQADISGPEKNTVIAVTGPSGSGKSHLVRWLRAHLSEDDSRYHLIYVPRELATLRELIGRVLDGMPDSPAVEAVRQQLDKAIAEKRPEQLAEELLDRLRSVITYELPSISGDDGQDVRAVLLGATRSQDDVRRENGLGDLLLVRAVRDHLLRPDGAVAGIVESLRGQRAGRDEQVPEFELDEIRSLKKASIQKQVDAELRSVWMIVQRAPEAAVAVLNEALPRAVAEALGMQDGVNLGEVFRSAREKLRHEGKDLVLLFEDLAQFGLFDGEIFNQFSVQPEASLAPIRAVFAITDGKFRDTVPDTVRTRLAHKFEVVGISSSDEGDAATTALLSRYLNVARVGKDRLLAAWDAANTGQRQDGSWVPNACLEFEGGGECPHREECWSAFGTSEDFGLYPYNRTAIRRAVAVDRSAMTPRFVVDSLVHDFLLEADIEIGSETFPSERTRGRFDFSVAMSKETVVPPSALSEDERDRLHRCRVIWNDGGIEPDGMRAAFVLPDLEGSVVEEDEDTPPGDAGPTPAPRRPTPLTSLFDWENGVALPEKEARFYRDTLFQLVNARVDLGSMLLYSSQGSAALLLNRVLTRNSFEFTAADPGRRAGSNQLRFELPPSAKSVRLLSAARWWWDHGHWVVTDETRGWDFQGDIGVARLELDEFLDSCADGVEGAVVACLMQGPLDPAAAAVTIRATALDILGVETVGDGSDLNTVLSDSVSHGVAPSEEWASTAAAARTALAKIDKSWVDSFATARQGDSRDAQSVDAARLVPALSAARQDPAGALGAPGKFDESFSVIAEQWSALQSELDHSLEAEREALLAVLDGIEDLLQDEPLDVVAGSMASAGRLAAENNVFRPHDSYSRFQTACDRLRATSPDLVNSWMARREVLRSGAASAIIDAQRWAAAGRQVLNDLQLLAVCVRATDEEVRQRLLHEIGESPDQISAELADDLGEISKSIRSGASK